METRAVIAVLGGGQLGRMLGLAGIPLGVAVPLPRPVAGRAGGRGRRPRGRRARRRGGAAPRSRAAPTSSPTSGKACRPTPRASSPRELAGAPRRTRRSRCRRTGSSRRRRFRALGIATARVRARSTTRDELDAAIDAGRAARGAQDAPRRLRRQGPGGPPRRRRRSTRGWAELGGVPLHPRGARARSTASCRSSRCAASTARSRAGRSSRTATSDGILRVSRAPAPGLDDALQARGEAARAAAARASSTTSACSRSSCSTSTASCSPTSSRRACTTRATGPSRAPTPASSRTTCVRCSAGRSARPRRAAPSAMVNCIGDDARPRRGARDPRRAPPRLRQGAAPGPQARPRHRVADDATPRRRIEPSAPSTAPCSRTLTTSDGGVRPGRPRPTRAARRSRRR